MKILAVITDPDEVKKEENLQKIEGVEEPSILWGFITVLLISSLDSVQQL